MVIERDTDTAAAIEAARKKAAVKLRDYMISFSTRNEIDDSVRHASRRESETDRTEREWLDAVQEWFDACLADRVSQHDFDCLKEANELFDGK